MGSESVWGCINTRMSGYQDVAITNPHWQNINYAIYIDLSSSTLYVWGCLDGVRGCLDDVQMVSEGVWGVGKHQYQICWQKLC